MKVLCFGEILLRLAAPAHTRLFQKDCLEATFCGSEANVAVSLQNFGLETVFLTRLPNNDIGKAAGNSLRYFGVDISGVIYGEGRMGMYYLEKGASQRASKVIYDRQYSAMALADPHDFDWELIMKDVDWFHWTGITPALSKNMTEICMNACKIAHTKNIPVSCDLNYRKNLWDADKARNAMDALLPYVDVCIANEEDADKALGITVAKNDIESGTLNQDGYILSAKEICKKYGCKYVATTFRKSYSADHNGWSAMLYDKEKGKAYFSREYDIQIVDRVGSGDSFAAGIIYSLATGKENIDAIGFSVAASCLKHSIEGDFNRVTLEEVENLMLNGGSGRIQR